MRKFFYIICIVILTLFISTLSILATIGLETNKFNNFIQKKINNTNTNIFLELITVRFKLDIKNISLFLETTNPILKYRKATIPVQNVKVYIDFLSLIKGEPKIKKIYSVMNEIEIDQLKKISVNFKPSSIKSILNNKVQDGALNLEIEVFFNENNVFEDFIARGSVKELKTYLIGELILENTNFTFFADKTDVLLKNISSENQIFKLTEGDLKISLLPEISLETNFKTNIKYNYVQNLPFFDNQEYLKNITDFKIDLNNSFRINFDRTYKVKKYNYKSTGKIIKASFDMKNFQNIKLRDEHINKISIANSKIVTNISSEKKNFLVTGKYSLNGNNFLNFNLENEFNKKSTKFKINADYDNALDLKLINYDKSMGQVANIFIDFEKNKDFIKIGKLNYKEGKNSFLLENIVFKNGRFISLKTIKAKTYHKGTVNNDFIVNYGKKISIKGNRFDATKLPKIFNKKSSTNLFSNISKNIEIDFENIIAPLSEKITSFKLIGELDKGKFTKISSKGSFGGANFLDIKMNNDERNKKKYLEIYSDLTKPLLTEYSFFKGLTGGKLLFTSTIDQDSSNSNLKIENFKVINAPGMVKLLSLADLGGLADLAEGEGLSFDILEISMDKRNDTLKINEILALGPSISVLMEGYQDPSTTSLRGTLVPAKTLNKMIAKIPLIGDIIIPKEVGEGLFGISFKMKGPPGKIKTTINPIRTLTPRFIQKIIDKEKKKFK